MPSGLSFIRWAWTEVMPRRLDTAARTQGRIDLARRGRRDVALDQAGGEFARRNPVGWRSGPRSIAPPGGLGVSAVMPAAARAAAVGDCAVAVAALQEGGMVARHRIEVGGGGEGRLTPAALVPAPAGKPSPRRQGGGRRSATIWSISALLAPAPTAAAAGPWRRPAGEYGRRTARQHELAAEVDAPRLRPPSASTAASSPTARMRCRRTATACALGRDSSTVYTRALYKIRSGALSRAFQSRGIGFTFVIIQRRGVGLTAD